MSPKNSLLHVGLTALGWFGFAASSVADPGPRPSPVPPQSPAAATVPSSPPTFLSLNDGRVLQGKIQGDDSGYSLLQQGGILRFRKELVEGAFGSYQEIYRFKAERVPGRDPDERLKLAHWCLAHHLNAEAKAQLMAVLDLSPGNAQIKNMIANLDNALTREALRDEGIERTRGERPNDGRPAEVDAAIFRPGAAAASSLPTIFDLPTPLAVKRADEFTRSVHRVLQIHCARCHNEKHQGDFQLIQVKTRHDWTPNVARANLEAALRMVDPDSPSRSELLARSLVPHGPAKRPIFRGANDPDYQRLAVWVNSLRPRPAAEQAATTRFGPAEPAPSPADSEGFASGRARPSGVPVPPETPADGRPQPPATPNPRTPLPPGQFVAGSGSGIQPYAPPDAKFLVPYMMGGDRPKLETAPTPQAQPPSATSPAGPAPATTGVTLPPVPTSAATPAAPVAPAANIPAASAQAASKPPRKPVKLDPALLERALSNKYAPN
jgi:hypothetical protein